MVILHRGSTSTTIVTATVGSRSTQRSFECQFRWNGQPPDEPRSSSCASRYSTFCSRIGMSPVRIVAYLMPPPLPPCVKLLSSSTRQQQDWVLSATHTEWGESDIGFLEDSEEETRPTQSMI
jgi:hypothetical protein